MTYEPKFVITGRLLSMVEGIAALREKIESSTIGLSWVPAVQKDARTRNAHASTAIEGNPLTLPEVRALEEGGAPARPRDRSQREVLNYFAGLRFIEKNAGIKRIRHEDVLKLHAILGNEVMDQGDAGSYRSIPVRVGKYIPPQHASVSGLTHELLVWWNDESKKLSPVLSSAIIHYRFEAIHPFADVNGRTGRALALWELFRRGFDTNHIFSVDEYYWEDRPAYYAALERARREGEDLTSWLEYSAEGLLQTLEKVWSRIQSFRMEPAEKIVLRPRQERLLRLLRDKGKLAPAEIWEELAISRQGAMDLLKPLLEAGLVERVGTKKSGVYRLTGRPKER